MSRLAVSPVSVAALKADPDISALVAEYEIEAKSPELPGARPQWVQYEALEGLGALEIVCARDAGKLVGFVSVLLSSLPHYGGCTCVIESLFVSPRSRHTGAGRALIGAAEAIATRAGAALLITAPVGSALETILPRRGYRRSNTVFVRRPA